MTRFTGLPDLPQAGVDPWLVQFLDAVRQNLELLVGARNEPGNASQAVVHSDITTALLNNPHLQSLTARGSGYTIAGVQVPALIDYVDLLSDMTKLATDVAELRATLNTLLGQLRGTS